MSRLNTLTTLVSAGYPAWYSFGVSRGIIDTSQGLRTDLVTPVSGLQPEIRIDNNCVIISLLLDLLYSSEGEKENERDIENLNSDPTLHDVVLYLDSKNFNSGGISGKIELKSEKKEEIIKKLLLKFSPQAKKNAEITLKEYIQDLINLQSDDQIEEKKILEYLNKKIDEKALLKDLFKFEIKKEKTNKKKKLFYSQLYNNMLQSSSTTTTIHQKRKLLNMVKNDTYSASKK